MPARTVRFLSLATLATAAGCAGGSSAFTAPAPVVPKPFEYAASTGQYRFTSSTRATQSLMGQSQDVTSSGNRLMTISLTRPAPDTLLMTLVIDSISDVGPMGMSQPGLDKVPGAKYSAKLSPAGAFYSVSGPSESENQAAAGMTDEIGRALPRLRAILATGAMWTDTVSDKLRQRGLDVTRQAITKYTVVGDTTIGGEPVWKIQREATVSVTGSGTAQGQALTLESAGTMRGFLLMSKKGVLVGGEAEEQSTGKVVLTANGMEVGLTSTTSTKFTKVQ